MWKSTSRGFRVSMVKVGREFLRPSYGPSEVDPRFKKNSNQKQLSLKNCHGHNFQNITSQWNQSWLNTAAPPPPDGTFYSWTYLWNAQLKNLNLTWMNQKLTAELPTDFRKTFLHHFQSKHIWARWNDGSVFVFLPLVNWKQQRCALQYTPYQLQQSWSLDHFQIKYKYKHQIRKKDITKPQGCIFRLKCSHAELTKDHVLTSAYVNFF